MNPVRLEPFGFELGMIINYEEAVQYGLEDRMYRSDVILLSVEYKGIRNLREIALPPTYQKEVIVAMFALMVRSVFDIERITGLTIDWDYYGKRFDVLYNIDETK